MIQTIVETYDGTTASKRDCRFIKGEFYIKSKQCFLIDGTWYRINSGFIVYDHEKETWVVVKNTPTLVKGVIGFDSDKNDFIMGSFTANPYKNVTVALANGSTYPCIDYHILPNDVFKEDTQNMIYVQNSMKIGGKQPNNTYANNDYPFSLPYCCKHYPSDIANIIKTGAKAKTRNTTNIGDYVSNIGEYSFGFEFETNRGKIPNYKISEVGLMPLRDGSIQGIEFATIPLTGKHGIGVLENACDNLKKYTTFTEQESLHLHIGNTPTTKKFVGYLYTIACILEKEIYSLFPKYYAQTSKFKAKGKDYNMPLKKEIVAMTAEETFDNLAFYLSEGKKYQGFGSEHPSDPDGNQKWAISSRYHLINFIPLLFGSNKTIEFRCHVPTRDPIKVINWLYICSAIVKYANKECKNNTDLTTLKGLTLHKVIEDIYGYKLSQYLNEYIRLRKVNRVSDEENGDCVGSYEISAELQNKEMYQDIN
jgi:hypothetical protein